MRHLLPGKVNGPENTKKTDLLLSVNWQALKEEKIANADVQQQLGGVCVCCQKFGLMNYGPDIFGQCCMQKDKVLLRFWHFSESFCFCNDIVRVAIDKWPRESSHSRGCFSIEMRSHKF